jgi:hypothetical protein
MDTDERKFQDRQAAMADELGEVKLDLADMMRQRDNLPSESSSRQPR